MIRLEETGLAGPQQLSLPGQKNTESFPSMYQGGEVTKKINFAGIFARQCYLSSSRSTQHGSC